MWEWVVCRIKPNQERKAAFHLGCQGFGYYMPRYREDNDPRIRYLFPCYAFVHVLDRQTYALTSTIGVKAPLRLGAGGDVTICPDSVIAELRGREGPEGYVCMAQKGFEVEQPVRVNAGLFAGQHGLYEGMQSRERVSVLLGVLGEATRVYVALQQLEAA